MLLKFKISGRLRYQYLYSLLLKLPSYFVYTGSVFPAIGLVILAYLGCDPILFIAMLCLTSGFDGFRGSGSGVNIIDISPNYAGAVMGMVNTAGNVMGFVAPYVVGLLLSAGVSC